MVADRLRYVALAASVLVAGAGVVRAVTHPDDRPAVSVAAPTPSSRPAASAAGTPGPVRSTPAPRTLYPIPARPAPPTPCPPAPGSRPPARRPWRAPVTVPDAELPRPGAPVPRRPDLAALRGKGMWVYQWERTEGGDARAVVRRAKAAGLTQLWVRSGSSRQGFYAGPLLRELLPVAHAAGLRVLVWDFAYLHDPLADARRAVQTLAFRTPDGHRVDGFSPDIETAAEGTYANDRRARVYLDRVRRAAGDRPLIATVPRPTPRRLATYPYAAMAAYADAFAVMVYWSCHEPGRLAAEAVTGLRRWRRPVHLIGQAYDMASEGGRRGDPTPREIWRFLDVGRRSGAVGVSFYVWQTATAGQFRALSAYPWPRPR